MSKDKSLLSEVSSLFTEATLEDIFRKVTGENEVKILSWDFGEASNKGDGYLGIVDRVVVDGEAGGKPTKISLVVKSMPNNLGRRKTFRSTDFFYNEIIFYTEVFPKLQEFAESKGQDKLMVLPRCLAAVTDGENDFIALEDVSVLGFGPVTRQNTLTLSQCNLILTALAKFHAVSFALKDQNPQEFQKIAQKLYHTYYTSELFEWYKGFQARLINTAKDALAQEYPGSKGLERFSSYTNRELYDLSVDFCSRTNHPTSVITQGDAWAPNFLIRSSEGEEPIALALDFQLARCSSPVLDVAFCIYSTSEKALLDNHYTDMLKLYHEQLSNSVKTLGSDPEKLYPWETFMKEVKEQSVHGINFAIEAIPFVILDSSEAFDLDIIKGDDAIDVSDIWNIGPIKSKEGRRRLADVIMHAVENDYL